MMERTEGQPTGTARIATMDLPPEAKRDRETHGEAQLMASETEEAFRSRWTSIQTGFVDEPSRAVKEADELVAEVMKRLAEVFAQERSKLEDSWASQKEVGTEDLRVALQRYRSFFDRLLGVRAPGGA
jgi:hypothetical protein